MYIVHTLDKYNIDNMQKIYMQPAVKNLSSLEIYTISLKHQI